MRDEAWKRRTAGFLIQENSTRKVAPGEENEQQAILENGSSPKCDSEVVTRVLQTVSQLLMSFRVTADILGKDGKFPLSSGHGSLTSSLLFSTLSLCARRVGLGGSSSDTSGALLFPASRTFFL